MLLQVADRGFVLTAAHNLKDWGKVRYVISLQADGVVDLTTVQAEVTNNTSDIDFAILPLTAEMFARVARSKKFVRLSNVDIEGDVPKPGIHTIFGYPVELVLDAAQGDL